MKKITHIFLVLLFRAGMLFGQHQELNEPPKTYKLEEQESENKKSLLSAFRQGKVRGHFRYYFLATDNQNPLTDYYANAAGGGIHYETGSYQGFRFGLSGFYIFNIGSSDLSKPDSLTGQFNRYEIGLFDIEDALNKKDINRLEEFFLQYQYKNLKLLYGRQLMNNPFINLQDGRMRPTVVEGLTMDWALGSSGKLSASWLYGISPRSTTRWFDMGSSIGVYPTGVNPDGSKSAYKNQLESKGAGLLGIRSKLGGHLNVQFWDLFVEGIFNSALLQLDYALPLKSGAQFYA
ncbi:MAG TPA: OprD family outer membrane porin, partial [Saprospiraceae bacterium]|nr:OprD family outer membrane porin [Saprospiraceae bacterium]